jgi:hypothetical protein
MKQLPRDVLWRRLQPVAFSPCKAETPQAEACATKGPRFLLTRLHSVSSIRDAVRMSATYLEGEEQFPVVTQFGPALNKRLPAPNTGGLYKTQNQL